MGKRASERGMTLIETLIVVLIIAILASIAVATYLGARSKAVAADCLSERANAELADRSYQIAHEGAFAPSFEALVDAHLLDRIPRCPAGGTLEWVEYEVGGVRQRALGCSVHSPLPEKLLFATEFEGLDGIKILTGQWKIVDGKLMPVQPWGEHRVAFGDPGWTDVQIDVSATLLSGPGYGVYYRADGQAAITGYIFQFDPGYGNEFIVRKVINGAERSPIQRVKMPPNFDIRAPHDITIRVVGNQHTMMVDGQVVLQFTDSQFASGMAGLRSWSNSQVVFESATVRPAGT